MSLTFHTSEYPYLSNWLNNYPVFRNDLSYENKASQASVTDDWQKHYIPINRVTNIQWTKSTKIINYAELIVRAIDDNSNSLWSDASTYNNGIDDDLGMIEDIYGPIMPPKKRERIRIKIVNVRRGTPSICDDAGIDDDLGMIEDIYGPIMPPKKRERIRIKIVNVRRGTPSVCDEEGW